MSSETTDGYLRLILERAVARHQYGDAHDAIRKVFERNPASAFDLLAPYFEPEKVREPGGASIPVGVLGFFTPTHRFDGKELVPEWRDERVRGWLEGDARWLDLCASLRRDETLGFWARGVLRPATPDSVRAALERVRRTERVREPRTRSHASGDLLARYLRGQHDAVWQELRSAEAVAGDFREEALAISRETMRRFAVAADELASRMSALGWQALRGEMRTHPSLEADVELMRRAEQITDAPLPPALRAFWETVGGVDFVWDYDSDDEPPDLGFDFVHESLDALSVGSAATIRYAIEDWEDDHRGLTDPELGERFRVDLAPDALTKAGVSGGGPYGIELPFLGVDPMFGNEEWSAPFVEYLRTAIRWAGFPGLAGDQVSEDVARFVAKLSRGLEPF